MTSLYSLVITLVLFWWIIKHIIRKKYLVTGEWSQSRENRMGRGALRADDSLQELLIMGCLLPASSH